MTGAHGRADNRTASAITPVDDSTCDVRFSVWIGRRAGDERDHSESAHRHARGVVEQSVDVSCHHSADTWREVGYGLPVDHPDLPAMLEKYTAVFADSVYLKADGFGLELDEVTLYYQLGACTKDVDLGWYQLPKGLAGRQLREVPGPRRRRTRVETHLDWQMTPHTNPSWDIKGCYITQIKGDPQIYNRHMIFPAPGVDLSDPSDFASIGMTVTGMPALARHSVGRRGSARDRDQCRPAAAGLRR